jgi:hypothetical protein
MRRRPVGCEPSRTLYAVETAVTRGEVEVTALDHHGDPLSAAARRELVAGRALVAFAPTDPNHVESLHVRVRDAEGHRFDWVVSAGGTDDGSAE